MLAAADFLQLGVLMNTLRSHASLLDSVSHAALRLPSKVPRGAVLTACQYLQRMGCVTTCDDAGRAVQVRKRFMTS